MRTHLLTAIVFTILVSRSMSAQQSIVGHWEGSIKIQGQELFINVDVNSADAGLAATIDIPQQNAKGLSLKNVRYQHPIVHFELPAGPGLATFEGERTDSLIAGKFTQAGMAGVFSLKLANHIKPNMVEGTPANYRPIVGVWDGAIDIMKRSIGISIVFKMQDGALNATVDIPEQSAMNLPLINVRFDSSRVHCELPAGPGLAVFDGDLKDDSIKGVFTQAGGKGDFHLLRGVAKKVVEQPEEAVPYKQEEVVFYNDTLKFSGTLTIPATAGKHPAVVMITGSGPQNRDEELFGFKPFRIIADHFTRNGIAVLRYDDRGVGGSAGSVNLSTTADFAKDALAAIRFLQARSDINPKQIGLCGHSEGGIVGPLAASESRDVAFVICIAGTGVDGRKTILAQQEAIMRADSSSEDAIKRALKVSNLAFDLALSQKDSVEVRKELQASVVDELNSMTSEQRKAITNDDEYVRVRVEAQMSSFRSPWFKYFLTYDPAPALEKVKCPLLALFGGLDMQVLADLNRKAMESALKKGRNKDYTIKIFPKANHLFLTAVTGSPSEYSKLKKEFVPGFLDTMSDWILKHVAIPK